MGYYTCYSLEVKGATQEQVKKITEWIAEKHLYGLYGSPYKFEDGTYQYECLESMKWYSYEEDITALSTTMPNATFKLHGDGEDEEDKWYMYFKNGESERCSVIMYYPEPKEIKWDN